MIGTILLIALLVITVIAIWPRRSKQAHLYWYKVGVSQEAKGMMNIVEHSAQGATIRLDQRELLLVMALVQEGRDSFGCNTVSGKALDELFSSANVLVEGARRESQMKTKMRHEIRGVATSAHSAYNVPSNS